MDPTPSEPTRNPYSPPVAPVADVAIAMRPMPAAVRRALFVYGISFVLGMVLQWLNPLVADGRYAELTAVSTALVILVAAWLFWKISVGRNWARIVLLVLTVISVPFGFIELMQIAPARPVMAGLRLIELGLDIAVNCLLFFPGREYFRPLPR